MWEPEFHPRKENFNKVPIRVKLTPRFPERKYWKNPLHHIGEFVKAGGPLYRHGIRNCARICFTVDLEGYRTQSTR